jgi:N-acetyl-anhydromuramyl-L-alanine amidase AmpD
MTTPFPELYPKADQKHLGALKAVADLKPTGVTVHYTADRDLDRAVRALAARELGYHLIIDRAGAVFQFVPFSKGVWHAGKAMWGSLSPNRAHIAVSLVSWGEVECLAPGAFQSWNAQTVPTDEVVQRQVEWWDAATAAQEAALLEVLAWVCGHGIDVSAICGHDECALPKGRKIDPGGVISMTMQELRNAVRSRLAAQAPTG